MHMKMEKKMDAALKRVDMTAIIILFFLAVVMAYYAMLQSEMREKLIVNRELIATKSAEQINDYLATGINIIRVASHTLDDMIREGKPHSEMYDMLVSQSAAVAHITSGNSTGIYAVVEDDFLDGTVTGWIPDPDYVPRERPWYSGATANLGQVAVVGPYIDAETHTRMITLSKALCDVKSVAAIDLSLEHLQNMTEELAAQSESDIEIVMDRRYQVVAHSNPEEVGKNYMEEKGTFGRTLIDKMRSADKNYFSFQYNNAEYVAYTVPVANEWRCLSVFDATASFAQLRRLFVLTLAVALLVISLILFLATRYEKKKLLAQELNLKAENAAAANEAKSAFLSNMSHEIRTPINAVLGMNEMILRESREPNVIEYAENIHTAGNSLLGIVNDILDFSKIEAGKMEIIPVDYDLSSLINDLVNMIHTRADAKGLSLVLACDQEMPKQLYGDEVRLKQVITNILTNAVKYTEKGSVTLSLGFERIEVEPENVLLNVAVKDTGIGIKPEDMDKLFSKFERIEEKRNRNVEGTGLGMAITLNLLEKMGSSLQVESTYGVGSTFSFKLRQRVVKWEPLGDYKEAYQALLKGHKKYQEKFTAPEAKVLVVDDNPMNLTVFKSLVKKTQVIIDTANDGDEGILLAQNKKYDIIFLDHMMPRKDGIETLHELQAQKGGPNDNTPIICLTANAISGAREQYLEAGFHDYLTKPIDADKLERLMMEYLPQEKIREAGAEEAAAEDTLALPEVLAPLRQADWLDLEQGAANSGSAADYLLLLQIFYESVDEMAAMLEGFYAERNLKDYTIKVHALKSSARTIGAWAFGEEAQMMENAGKSGNMDYIRAHHEGFMATYRGFKAQLAKVFAAEKTDEAEEKPAADLNLMAGFYEELRAAAEEMDCDRLEEIFVRMEEYRIPESEAEVCKKLKQANDRFDYEVILSLLE
ncbi:putative two-component system hybrid sensor and regulator [Selenomonas ruminantium subsp. lactilytica TAM6421]|uniref:Circadian input-output histidine kinase CikA n=1 Tax=Selenomonas ruminantium subsp. lactilytica (strain NBRC 103574 / TAM6421) TaxID=927704 RepID=I0GUK8_SELRL|nr:response regulator [Selenomonas ruminantium]BAL84445.1 putative two-component system hybrid sensor and regulator [Selenomonas ruminantium subsp. lactilytica TAM6421]